MVNVPIGTGYLFPEHYHSLNKRVGCLSILALCISEPYGLPPSLIPFGYVASQFSLAASAERACLSRSDRENINLMLDDLQALIHYLLAKQLL